jgi:hypothetical protein
MAGTDSVGGQRANPVRHLIDSNPKIFMSSMVDETNG